MPDLGVSLSSLKQIAAVLTASGKIELTQQVIELQNTMLAMQEERLKAAQERDTWRERALELVKLIRLHEEFQFERNAYWRVEGTDREGPFCSRCFDVDQKAVRMVQNQEEVAHCPGCKTAIRLDGPVPRPAPRIRGVRHPGWVRDY